MKLELGAKRNFIFEYLNNCKKYTKKHTCLWNNFK